VLPLLPQRDALLAFSAIAARDMGMYRRIALVNGHTLLQKMGTSAPLTLKMMKKKNLFRETMRSLCSECSVHKYNHLKRYNAIICSKFSLSSTISEHVSSLMEATAIIW
jgi:hypothetical protein